MSTLGRATSEHALDAALFCALAMASSLVLSVAAHSFWPMLGYIPAWIVPIRVAVAMRREINGLEEGFLRFGNLVIIPHPLNRPTAPRRDDLPLVPLRGKNHGS